MRAGVLDAAHPLCGVQALAERIREVDLQIVDGVGRPLLIEDRAASVRLSALKITGNPSYAGY
jgi:hypothetical protein